MLSRRHTGSNIIHRSHPYETNPLAGDRYGYTGKEFDATTGLQYNDARYYDARIGAWTSQDPDGVNARDTDLYRYVANQPTILVDPTGTEERSWGQIALETAFPIVGLVNYARSSDGSPPKEGVHSFAQGAVLGDFSGNETWSALGGQVVVGIVPGAGQVADVRDTGAAVWKVINGEEGGWFALGAAGIGWFPVFGDGAKGFMRGSKKVVKEVITEGTEKVAKEGVEKATKESAERGLKVNPVDIEDARAADPNIIDAYTSGGAPQVTPKAVTDLIQDSNKKFPLTEGNARVALDPPPGATRIEVAGSGGAGADVRFYGPDGSLILQREVKSTAGSYNTFNQHLSKAAKSQVQGAGEVIIQVPAGTDIAGWLQKFRRTPGRNLNDYGGVRLNVLDDAGNSLYSGTIN